MSATGQNQSGSRARQVGQPKDARSEEAVSHTRDSRSAPADGVELTRLLRSLAELVRLLADVGTLEELLEIAGEHVRMGLRASSVSLSRLELGTGMLRTLVNVGMLGPTETRWPDDELYNLLDFERLREMVSNRQMWEVTVDDVDADTAELRLLAELGKEAALGATLVVNDTLWGELYVTYAHVDELRPAEDRAYLEVYLAIVESALARVQQIQSLELLAYQDPLTGLANRRALDEAAASAFAKLGLSELTCITVVAFDLNGLKQVNDRLGHGAGDRLIISAASLIRAHFNGLPGSLAARVGGDEFVVLVPGHGPELVTSAARAACAAVADLSLGAGASCGVASAYAARGRCLVSDVFRRADEALYSSKLTGRLVALGTA